MVKNEFSFMKDPQQKHDPYVCMCINVCVFVCVWEFVLGID